MSPVSTDSSLNCVPSSFSPFLFSLFIVNVYSGILSLIKVTSAKALSTSSFSVIVPFEKSVLSGGKQNANYC